MTFALQIIIISLGILLLSIIIIATIEKKISESHALLWIVPCLLIIIGGIFPQLTYILSDFFHTGYPPAIVFALAIIISYLILFQCFKALSVLTIKNKELASQTALLNQKIEQLEKTIKQLQLQTSAEKSKTVSAAAGQNLPADEKNTPKQQP